MSSEQPIVRQHILDTARPIILTKGFSAVGLNEILSAADVPKGSFYHYFRSKELFGEALLDAYFADYRERLDALLGADGTTAADRLMRYWTLWLETQSSEDAAGKCLAVKLGGEVSDLSEAMRVALERGTGCIVERLAACIREGVEDASLAAELEPHGTALALYDMWLGATLLTKIRRDRAPLEAALAATHKLLKPAFPAAA